MNTLQPPGDASQTYGTAGPSGCQQQGQLSNESADTAAPATPASPNASIGASTTRGTLGTTQPGSASSVASSLSGFDHGDADNSPPDGGAGRQFVGGASPSRGAEGLLDRQDSAHYQARPPGLLERQDSAHALEARSEATAQLAASPDRNDSAQSLEAALGAVAGALRRSGSGMMRRVRSASSDALRQQAETAGLVQRQDSAHERHLSVSVAEDVEEGGASSLQHRDSAVETLTLARQVALQSEPIQIRRTSIGEMPHRRSSFRGREHFSSRRSDSLPAFAGAAFSSACRSDSPHITPRSQGPSLDPLIEARRLIASQAGPSSSSGPAAIPEETVAARFDSALQPLAAARRVLLAELGISPPGASSSASSHMAYSSAHAQAGPSSVSAGPSTSALPRCNTAPAHYMSAEAALLGLKRDSPMEEEGRLQEARRVVLTSIADDPGPSSGSPQRGSPARTPPRARRDSARHDHSPQDQPESSSARQQGPRSLLETHRRGDSANSMGSQGSFARAASDAAVNIRGGRDELRSSSASARERRAWRTASFASAGGDSDTEMELYGSARR